MTAWEETFETNKFAILYIACCEPVNYFQTIKAASQVYFRHCCRSRITLLKHVKKRVIVMRVLVVG